MCDFSFCFSIPCLMGPGALFLLKLHIYLYKYIYIYFRVLQYFSVAFLS